LDIKITKPEGIVLTLALSDDEAGELLEAAILVAAHTGSLTVMDRLAGALEDEAVSPSDFISDQVCDAVRA
jgi:hypothetical protein